MTAIKLTVDQALALADSQTRGETIHPDSNSLYAVLLVLAEEVRRLRGEIEPLKSDLDTYMRIANEEVNRAAELEADAARYRYLRDNCAGFEITVLERDEDDWETWVSGYPPDELDIAIDAAIDTAMESSNAG